MTMKGTERKPNRLSSEKSPYLLEHAMNPVDWYPWGKEAFSKARNDNKPIFLSIGYSTCHWCHQLARESFEDARTAAFINKNFIPIKVDREERPEVDAYYMSAVQAMTGGGGWPLTVFLTPELKPFYGGTYFPPEPRYGMASFMQVLEFVSNLWKEKRGEVLENSNQVIKAITPIEGEKHELGRSVLDEGYATLVSSFDIEHGGFGAAPKFPLPGTLGFLLRYHARTGKALALDSVLKTLNEMMAGGIRDHVGGGFHRYSTDRVWLVPHFEKMLYDNALLAKVYAEAYQIAGKEEYAEVVRETLGWMAEEMKAKEGGFYSAQDADTSEGEGVYYTWTPEEVESALGEADASAFNRVFGVTKTGNFEGRTILHMDPARSSAAEWAATTRSKKALYRVRLQRPRPSTDTKLLTSWNGLAISSFAFAGAVLRDKGLVGTASGAADFVLRINSENGRLLRRSAGGEAALDGTLEDYAFFVQGLLDLFESDPDPRWLKEAIRLTGLMVGEFEDRDGGGFYLARPGELSGMKETYDGPMPSGNSIAILNLTRLSELTGDMEFRKSAEKALSAFGREVDRQPTAHTAMLGAVDMLLNGTKEVVVSAPKEPGSRGLRDEVFRTFLPAKVVMTVTRDTYNDLAGLSTLLEGRKPTESARAFVCQGFACKLPANSVRELREQLSDKRE